MQNHSEAASQGNIFIRAHASLALKKDLESLGIRSVNRRAEALFFFR